MHPTVTSLMNRERKREGERERGREAESQRVREPESQRKQRERGGGRERDLMNAEVVKLDCEPIVHPKSSKASVEAAGCSVSAECFAEREKGQR